MKNCFWLIKISRKLCWKSTICLEPIRNFAKETANYLSKVKDKKFNSDKLSLFWKGTRRNVRK